MTIDRNERVMEMVEEALREDPDVSNEQLQERAAEIDPRVGELSPRSFNARYPLQVKRKRAAEQQREEGGLRERIMKRVRELVEKGEDFSTQQIQERVAEYVPKVKDLSTREFHTRYAKRIMEKLSGKKVRTEVSGEFRSALRDTLIDYAKDVSAAEDRGEVIQLVENVDEYVDRVMTEVDAR